MSFRDPRRRKPIRDKELLDEIKDNVKNNAVLTSSRSRRKSKLSNSDEEFVETELHQTYTIRSSPRNDSRRNSGTNINRVTQQKLRSLSPAYNGRPTNTNSDDDISDDEDESKDSSRNRSIENNSATHYEQKIYYSKTNYNTRPHYTPENRSRLSLTKLNKSTSDSNNFLIIVVCLIALFGLLYFLMSSTDSMDIGTQTKAIDVNSESQVLNDVLITFKNMKSKYKNQNRNLWLDAYSSIATLINQETKKPSIIVLLGNKSDPLECLARLIGNVSSKALRSDRLVLTPKEFEADMGSVIQTMRSHLKDNKAIIVSDLLNINVEALKAFHNLCDRINPLVEEAIYIITIIADDYDDNHNPLKYIENELHKKLSGKMREDAIQPLISRLTDGPILTVKPEPTVTDCSL